MSSEQPNQSASTAQNVFENHVPSPGKAPKPSTEVEGDSIDQITAIDLPQFSMKEHPLASAKVSETSFKKHETDPENWAISMHNSSRPETLDVNHNEGMNPPTAPAIPDIKLAIPSLVSSGKNKIVGKNPNTSARFPGTRSSLPKREYTSQLLHNADTITKIQEFCSQDAKNDEPKEYIEDDKAKEGEEASENSQKTKKKKKRKKKKKNNSTTENTSETFDIHRYFINRIPENCEYQERRKFPDFLAPEFIKFRCVNSHSEANAKITDSPEGQILDRTDQESERIRFLGCPPDFHHIYKAYSVLQKSPVVFFNFDKKSGQAEITEIRASLTERISQLIEELRQEADTISDRLDQLVTPDQAPFTDEEKKIAEYARTNPKDKAYAATHQSLLTRMNDSIESLKTQSNSLEADAQRLYRQALLLEKVQVVATGDKTSLSIRIDEYVASPSDKIAGFKEGARDLLQWIGSYFDDFSFQLKGQENAHKPAVKLQAVNTFSGNIIAVRFEYNVADEIVWDRAARIHFADELLPQKNIIMSTPPIEGASGCYHIRHMLISRTSEATPITILLVQGCMQRMDLISQSKC